MAPGLERTLVPVGLCYQVYHYRFYQFGPDNFCYRTYQFRADNLSARVPGEASKALSGPEGSSWSRGSKEHWC